MPERALGVARVVRNAKVFGTCAADFTEHHHGPLTAVATILLALFTTTLWWATWNLVHHAHQIERAYMSGGGGRSSRDPTQFVLTVQNYGKTPGTVSAYALFVCDRDALPRRPDYLAVAYTPTCFVATYPPGGPTLPITQRRIPQVAEPIAYGRIWYSDIWGDEHHFSFVLPTETPDDHSILVGISDDYTHST